MPRKPDLRRARIIVAMLARGESVGVPPSLREMAKQAGVSHPSVLRTILWLHRQGMVTLGHGKHRSVRLLRRLPPGGM